MSALSQHMSWLNGSLIHHQASHRGGFSTDEINHEHLGGIHNVDAHVKEMFYNAYQPLSVRLCKAADPAHMLY